MRIQFTKIVLLLLFAFASVSGKAANGDGSGTLTVINTEIATGGSDTTFLFSENFYLGPNTAWTISGVVMIYAKNVWISPGASVTGSGKLIFNNPGDNPFWDDMAESPTYIDGNDNSNYITVSVELNNANGMAIANVDDPGYGTELTTNNSVRFGNTVGLMIDGANILLGASVQGDLIFDANGSLVNYSDKRMVITNNSILSHVVKSNYTGDFVFPVGINNASTNASYYSPVAVNAAVTNTVYVSAVDFATSASDETKLRTKGIGITWHIYAATTGMATVTAQHNTTLNGAIGGGSLPYADPSAGLLQSNATGLWGSYASFIFSKAIGNLQYSGADMTDAVKHDGSFTLTTLATGTSGYYTLDAKNDLDWDDDGITNVNEGGGSDAYGDCDEDGILNYQDATPGCTALSGNDPWGKAYKALTWTDCNGDNVNDFFDTDRDGVPDAMDLDSDNDGILDVQEARPGGVAAVDVSGHVTGTDDDGNGILSQADNGNTNATLNGLQAQDLDKDKLPSFIDLDSDGDGLTDRSEALGTYDSDGLMDGTDTDGDGVGGETYFSNSAGVADNAEGLNAKGLTLIDSDGDGYPNVFDIDSDNDGITDNAELQATCSNKLPSGTDTDGDGVDDNYDISASCVPASAGLTPFDKDGDAIPDYLDTDTDNDGVPDIYEGNNIYGVSNYWAGATGDADKDGLIDYFDGYNIESNSLTNWYNVYTNNLGNNGSVVTPAGLIGGSTVQLPEDEGKGCSGGGERNWRNLIVLPVTLIEFKGNLNNGIVTLEWMAATEINMSHYEVERSLDATAFSKIATQKAVNSGNNERYTTPDDVRSLPRGIVYYRLKMFDKNGKWKYSQIISFRLNAIKGEFSMYPNPAKNYVVLNIPAERNSNAEILVYNAAGQKVAQRTTGLMQGNNTITFHEIATLPSGTYTVRVQTETQAFAAKLVLVNER